MAGRESSNRVEFYGMEAVRELRFKRDRNGSMNDYVDPIRRLTYYRGFGFAAG